MSLEKDVLANLQNTVNIQECTKRKITEKYFLFDETKKLFQIMNWYFTTYGKILESDSLQMAYKLSSTISTDLQSKITLLFEELKTVVQVSNFTMLLDEFVQYHKQNLLKQAADKMIDKMQENDPDAAMSIMKTNLTQIEKELTSNIDTCKPIAEDAQQILFEYFDSKEHPEKYRGVYLGFPDFDLATNGLMPGTVTLIIGQMKSAKSVLATNIACNVANSGKRVYFHVNEGGRKLVESRYISCDTGLSYNGIRYGRLSPQEVQLYQDYCNNKLAKNDNLLIDNVNLSTPSYIESKLNSLTTLNKIDLVIIDYLGLMQPDAKQHVESEWLKWGIITLDLKRIAMKYQVPMIIIAHVNRKGMQSDNKKNFGLEDLGLSLEPLKHVDMIASWRIADPEVFKLTHVGTGYLSIQGARDAEEPDVSLHVNTNIMKIQALTVTVIH